MDSKKRPSATLQAGSGKARPVVLLVDDEAPILASLRRLMKNEPYEVLATEDPQEALEWVRTRPIDLILSDYRMPGMSGSELLQAVSADSPETVRVMLTGYPGETLVLKGLGSGLYWMVGKPWDDDKLKHTLRRLLHLPE